MFKSSERVVFNNNPLAEVICQLRFPTILSISSLAPAEFQDKIRSYFPLYVREDTGPPIPEPVAGLIQQVGAPLPGTGVKHNFSNSEDNKVITLTEGSVAVSDRNYLSWESFYRSMRDATTALEEVYRPAHYARIGLRYVNLIDRQKLGIIDVPWQELINTELLGLLVVEDVRDEISHMKSEATLQISDIPGAQLTLRCGLTEPHKFVTDADLYIGGTNALDSIDAILPRFNKYNGDLFRWAIKPELQKALSPK